jgi:16S rRNA processing protein RimM
VGTDSSCTLVEIGVVGRAHGIGGATHIFLHNPGSRIFDTIDHIIVENRDGQKKIRIVETRNAAKSLIAIFEGISTRTEAEKLKGAKLLILRDQLPTLREDEFYVADLIGATAWDNDLLIGRVTSSRPQGDIEMITVTGESTSVEVPLVDDFVIKVDISARKILLTDTHLLPSSPVMRNVRK